MFRFNRNAGFLHLEFEALHPFKDGNGRIGRMMITLYLWKCGLISFPHFYISGYLEENKNEYIERMRDVSANGTWELRCEFFLTAIRAQAINNLKINEEIVALYEEMKIKFSKILSSKWTMQVLNYIFTYPKFRIPAMHKIAGIPDRSIPKFIKRLLDEKIIIQQIPSSGRKPALYSFEPLMKLVRV